MVPVLVRLLNSDSRTRPSGSYIPFMTALWTRVALRIVHAPTTIQSIALHVRLGPDFNGGGICKYD